MDEREVTTRKSFPTQPHPHGTLFALGLNYADHASELEFKPPEEPLVFLKAPNTSLAITRPPCVQTILNTCTMKRSWW